MSKMALEIPYGSFCKDCMFLSRDYDDNCACLLFRDPPIPRREYSEVVYVKKSLICEAISDAK